MAKETFPLTSEVPSLCWLFKFARALVAFSSLKAFPHFHLEVVIEILRLSLNIFSPLDISIIYNLSLYSNCFSSQSFCLLSFYAHTARSLKFHLFFIIPPFPSALLVPINFLKPRQRSLFQLSTFPSSSIFISLSKTLCLVIIC